MAPTFGYKIGALFTCLILVVRTSLVTAGYDYGTYGQKTDAATTVTATTAANRDNRTAIARMPYVYGNEPGGLVSLPRSKIGCPLKEYFKGNISISKTDYGEWQSKHAPHLEIHPGSSIGVCNKTIEKGWPKGEYCLFRQSRDCPDFMKKGQIEVVSHIKRFTFQYCCMDEINEAPVKLPFMYGEHVQPFYLLPLKRKTCQKVSEYVSKIEKIQWHKDHFTVNTTGVVADYDTEHDGLTFEFCYYQQAWPVGDYRLVQAGDICPSYGRQFDTAHIEIGDYFEISEHSLHLKTGSTNIIWMCQRCPNGSQTSWPNGRYCIYRGRQTCPTMFEEGFDKFIGINWKKPLEFHYCCLNDLTDEPIDLPTEQSFYLLPDRYHHQCQQVKGMTVEIEELSFRPKFPMISNLSSHLIVKKKTRPEEFTLSMCYYEADISKRAGTPAPRNYLAIVAGPSVTTGCLVILIMVGCRCMGRSRRHKKRDRPLAACTARSTMCLGTPLQETSQRHQENGPLQIGSLLKMILGVESQMIIYGILIHPDKLEMLEKVGKGAFGTVFQGRYKPDKNPMHVQEVAIKTLKDNCVYPEISAFMEEAIVMAEFNHINVLSIVGVCLKEETDVPMIVLPFMQHGDLQKYLRQFRYNDDKKDKIPDLTQLLSFSLHIARGMVYLANMKVVHRDLAARNCMLDSRMVVKVADFGLSRDIYASSYYRQDKNKLLPIKWMALESLQDRVFTSYTDVWSYGVTVWEIFTLGKVPYPNLDNGQVLPELETGMRLNKPDTCPDTTYELLLNCWLENPKDRPDFTKISHTLEEALTGLCGYLDLDQQEKSASDLTAGIICIPDKLADTENHTVGHMSYPDKLADNGNNAVGQLSYADYRELVIKRNALV